jgi:phosphoglycolate phosphatase
VIAIKKDLKKMPSNIFFDLDGTLTDSQEGIIKCYRYALDKLDLPFTVELDSSIVGPPLRVIFKKLLGSNDEVLIEKAVATYRERFSTIGLFENQVYMGIPEMLSALNEKSHELYVVTGKPKVFADRIIDHFQLTPFFIEVYGTELGGRFDNKADLIEHVLRSRNLNKAEAVMVGDKKEDITAGKTNRITTIGVTYGYGSLQEITEAAPDYICNNPAEIQKLLMAMK